MSPTSSGRRSLRTCVATLFLFVFFGVFSVYYVSRLCNFIAFLLLTIFSRVSGKTGVFLGSVPGFWLSRFVCRDVCLDGVCHGVKLLSSDVFAHGSSTPDQYRGLTSITRQKIQLLKLLWIPCPTSKWIRMYLGFVTTAITAVCFLIRRKSRHVHWFCWMSTDKGKKLQFRFGDKPLQPF